MFLKGFFLKVIKSQDCVVKVHSDIYQIDKLYGGKTVFNIISSYIVTACAPIHAFLEFPLTNNPHNILSKPLAAFLHNFPQNKCQQEEKNESWKEIDCARDQINNILFSSSVSHQLSYEGLVNFYKNIFQNIKP